MSVLLGSVLLRPDQLLSSGILSMRLYRTVAAMITGAGLSVSGVIFQAILRNPLADPYVLGVSSGASLGASVGLAFGLALWGAWTVSVAAFLGAMVAIILVYTLARESNGKVHTYSLLLTGVMFNAIAGGLLTLILAVAPADRLPGIIWWLMGSLQIFDLKLLAVCGVLVFISIVISSFFGPSLNPMLFGDEKAASLGLNPHRIRVLVFVLASVITASCVSLCGMIGFVGLMIPHLMRLFIGTDYRRLIPVCALAGAAFLPLADTAARLVSCLGLPNELPVGMVTALMGAPFFIAVMIQKRARQ